MCVYVCFCVSESGECVWFLCGMCVFSVSVRVMWVDCVCVCCVWCLCVSCVFVCVWNFCGVSEWCVCVSVCCV
jgi:hypothetical protein